MLYEEKLRSPPWPPTAYLITAKPSNTAFEKYDRICFTLVFFFYLHRNSQKYLKHTPRSFFYQGYTTISFLDKFISLKCLFKTLSTSFLQSHFPWTKLESAFKSTTIQPNFDFFTQTDCLYIFTSHSQEISMFCRKTIRLLSDFIAYHLSVTMPRMFDGNRSRRLNVLTEVRQDLNDQLTMGPYRRYFQKLA